MMSRHSQGAIKHPAQSPRFAFARSFFVGIIDVGVADERQGPTLADHPAVDILATDLTGGERASVAILTMTGPGLAARIFLKLVACCNSTRPAPALSIKAELIRLRRVNPFRPMRV